MTLTEQQRAEGPRRRSCEFFHNSLGPVCPHCSCQHIADEAFYYDEGLTQLECEHCCKSFRVRVVTDTTWTTNIEDRPEPQA